MVVYDSSYFTKCELIAMIEFKRSGENPGPMKYNIKTLKFNTDVK